MDFKYEDVEFPLPETFDDDYATRCDAARTQEMRIADWRYPQITRCHTQDNMLLVDHDHSKR